MDMTPEAFGELAMTLKKAECSELHLKNCTLSADKLRELCQRCCEENIEVRAFLSMKFGW